MLVYLSSFERSIVSRLIFPGTQGGQVEDVNVSCKTLRWTKESTKVTKPVTVSLAGFVEGELPLISESHNFMSYSPALPLKALLVLTLNASKLLIFSPENFSTVGLSPLTL
mgnify:CR=1 FL=1